MLAKEKIGNASQTRLPGFLVIGGMKCGTTTLHGDLELHPDICCGTKELNALTDRSGRAVTDIYQKSFASGHTDQLYGDVSTTYAMLPDHAGVVERAAKLLGPDLKLIYVVREPIARTISHHQHMMNSGSEQRMNPDVNLEIQRNSSLIDYSRYAYQIEPWLEKFGREQVCLVRFEDYINDRGGSLDILFKFLELRPHDVLPHESGANRGDTRLTAGSKIFKLYQTQFFKNVLKPYTPPSARSFFRRLLLKPAVQSYIAPSKKTIDQIYNAVHDDAKRLAGLFGHKTPLWDLDLARRKFSGVLTDESLSRVQR